MYKKFCDKCGKEININNNNDICDECITKVNEINLKCPNCGGTHGHLILIMRSQKVREFGSTSYYKDMPHTAFECDCGSVAIFDDMIDDRYAKVDSRRMLI